MNLDLQLAVLGAAEVGVWDPLWDMLLLLAVALLLGTLAERLGQSVIVGYVLAGTLVGPSVLGWISQDDQILHIAELGVALLLFVIGLEFSPRRLWELGRTTSGVGPLQVAVTTAAATGAAMLFALGVAESLVIGMMVAMSSTACVLRLLADRAEIESLHGRAALGVLLVQDVAVVPMMLLVSAMVGGAAIGTIAWKLSMSLVLGLLLIGVFYLLFNVVAPRLLALKTWRRNRDLPVLLAVIMATGSAWAANRLGLSPALGAFAAGVLLAVSPFATQIRADVRPLSTLLVTLFFASIGMFGDPLWLVQNWLLVGGIVLAIIVGKPLIIVLLARGFGQPWRYAAATGLCLAQVGEFSFVLATIAQKSDAGGAALMSETTFRAMVSATIVTLLVTPYFVAAAPWAGAFFERLILRKKQHGPAAPAESPAGEPKGAGESGADNILIIGFGPAGQRVAEGLMHRYEKQMTVLDLNTDNIGVARRYGLAGHLGDATQSDVLEHAGIHVARVVVIALPDQRTTRELIYQVRDLAPNAYIIARCRYHVRHWELLLAGAHEVVDEEDQVGRRLAAEVRQVLGDVPESS
jgi:CPA2 family monovalent cation:H+ antiporter-2